jgi:hypothetical protein
MVEGLVSLALKSVAPVLRTVKEVEHKIRVNVLQHHDCRAQIRRFVILLVYPYLCDELAEAQSILICK